MELKGREAACFLFGYVACLTKLRRKVPEEVQAAAFTAGEVLHGGTFRGPLVIFDMQDVANRIIREAATR